MCVPAPIQCPGNSVILATPLINSNSSTIAGHAGAILVTVALIAKTHGKIKKIVQNITSENSTLNAHVYIRK